MERGDSIRYLVANIEVKNELCSGHAEASMENAAYYCHYWAQDLKKTIRDACVCPAVLLNVVGPYISASVAAFTAAGVVVMPVTPLIPMLLIPDNDMMDALARLTTALRCGLESLAGFYATVMQERLGSTVPDFPYTNFYSDQASAQHQFTFLEQIGSKLVWRAVDDDDSPIVVKFCKRYSVALHRVCAELDVAPRLRGLSELPNHRMVVMDAVPANFVRLDAYLAHSPDPSTVAACHYSALEAMLAIHAKGLVHGDLRPPNIYIDAHAHKVLFIDFDWGGTFVDGDSACAQYPSFLNRIVEWPAGVTDNGPILPEHDIACLKFAFTGQW